MMRQDAGESHLNEGLSGIEGFLSGLTVICRRISIHAHFPDKCPLTTVMRDVDENLRGGQVDRAKIER